MGWSVQGYDSKIEKWTVYGNGHNEKIEKFNLAPYEFEISVIRVLYGTSNQFFHGYISSSSEFEARDKLSIFNKNLVYETKYGDEAYEFNSQNLKFIKTENLCFFTEQIIFYDFEWTNLINELDYALCIDIKDDYIRNEIRSLNIPVDFNTKLKEVTEMINMKLKNGTSKREIEETVIKPIRRKDFVDKLYWTLKYMNKIKW